MDAVDTPGEETVAETNVKSELHSAFWSLDKAIRNNKRYHVLLPHWEVLVAGLHQRHLPRPRVVSLVDSGDLVEMGESQHVA